MLRLIFLFFALPALSSCSHFIKRRPAAPAAPPVSHFEESTSVSYRTLNEPYKSSYGEIPMENHPKVDMWVSYFTGKGRDLMRLYLERSSRYLPMMKTVMREEKLPENLAYVALIESGFSPKAHSRANAVGYWQFIHGTGKSYGLRIDGFVDERRDPVLSTRAAAAYFKRLYSLFGSWHLALSSYNAGEYRVNRAMMRHYSRDFWHLSSVRALPRETRNYAPKLIAAIRIAKDPQKYGFHNVAFQEPLSYDIISLKKPISIKKLAGHLGISEESLKALNPMYKGEYVPIYGDQTFFRLPPGSASLAQAFLEKSFMKAPRRGYYHYQWYRVRRGDSLSRIARRHRTTVRRLKRANGLRGSFIRAGRRLKIPSRRLIAQSLPAKKAAARRSSKALPEVHIVKRGESLSKIARRYRLPAGELQSLNRLSGRSVIHPGQKLKIAADRGGAKAAPADSAAPREHIVKKGETLIGIAKKYKIGLPQLMKANSMTFKSVLLTGTRLVIPK